MRKPTRLEMHLYRLAWRYAKKSMWFAYHALWTELNQRHPDGAESLEYDVAVYLG